ncbi:hypothetical protein [Trinickia sp.]|uniref:hypothetical protein n=1 Tax=Trinickia sp. TaxID=2571163 RepID=UPI002F3E5103
MFRRARRGRHRERLENNFMPENQRRAPLKTPVYGKSKTLKIVKLEAGLYPI